MSTFVKLQVIGTPMLPPYWSLGFHLCRYGYTGLDNVKTVHDRMVAAGIPYVSFLFQILLEFLKLNSSYLIQDTQWVDIDYMDGYRVWTYDQNKWAGLPQFVQQLHGENRQFVTIVDPCIKSGDNSYGPLTTGMQQNVFLKVSNGNPFQGSVSNIRFLIFKFC